MSLFNELRREARISSANGKIDDISGYLVSTATDSSGIPFVSKEAEEGWQISQLRQTLPNISANNIKKLIKQYAPSYA